MIMTRRLAVVALACASLALSAAAAQPPSLAAAIEALENPTLGPSAKVQDLSIPLSKNMTMQLVSGSAAPVRAGDTVIGLFFSGKGSFLYRAGDPTEAVNVKFQANKTSDVKVSADGAVSVLKGDFERVFLRAAGVTLPQISGTDGAPLDEAFTKLREEMDKRRIAPWSHLLAKQMIDRPSAPVAWADFLGSDRPVTYVLDSIDDRSEQLYGNVKNRMIAIRELSNIWWPVVISDQPLNRSRKDFLDPLYLLTMLDYTLVADEKENADLVVTETIMPRAAAQKVFRFALFSTDYDTNGRPRTYSVRKVTDGAGKELSYHHARDQIVVGFPQAVGANQEAKIRFEIEGNFLYRPNANSFWQLGTAPWFPQPGLSGQYYKIHSIVKVKKPWIAFAPGQTVRRGDEGEYNVVENKVDVPVQFAVVHAGKYALDEKTYEDGMTIRVATYALSNDRAMKQLNNLAHKMIQFYEPWLGPFPFKEFNIIEINELGFGQAPPGTMFITKEAFNPLMGDDNKLFSQGINHRFAHEIAHQYWGHVVKMGSLDEQWITEAFAEYSSALVIKELKGKSDYNAMLATWRANANDANEMSSIAMANRIAIPGDAGLAGRNRFFLIYEKGAHVLAALHKELGDQKFLSFLRSLQGFFQWKFLTTSEMPKLLDRIEPGRDWKGFFDKYYWGTEMPKA
jgi:hypothetical protein